MSLSTRSDAYHFLLGLRERVARALLPAEPPLPTALSRQALRRNWPMRLGLMAAAMMATAAVARAWADADPPGQAGQLTVLAVMLAIAGLVAGLGVVLQVLVAQARRCQAWVDETLHLGAALAGGHLQPTPWPWQRRHLHP
jgi:hypothetical protein